MMALFFQVPNETRWYELNALYDIENQIYKNCTISVGQKEYNERNAAYQMLEQYDKENHHKAIVTMDRGYGGLNPIAHFNQLKNIKYVFRVQNSWIKEVQNLPQKEFDMEMCFVCAKKITKEIKELSNKLNIPYKKIQSSSKWDFKDGTVVKFRLCRIKLDNGEYETLATNLDKKEFPLSIMKELYFKHWGIETSFKYLKYALSAINFHTRKDEFAIQELYAHMIMYRALS